jgi:hypothetical protein
MNITPTEITWGTFKFCRAKVEGFFHEDKKFYIFIEPGLKIELGSELSPWPFFSSSQNNQPKLPCLIYEHYRFLPEHVLGYYDDKNQDSIRVWTRFGELTILRKLPENLAQMKIPAGFENSTANEWIEAYKRHKSDPFSI